MPCEDFGGGQDGSEFVVEFGECDLMDEVGGEGVAVEAFCGEGCGGVGCEIGGEAEVGGHSDGRGYAMLGGEADDEDGGDVLRAETGFEVGADEGAIDVFGEEGFGGEWLHYSFDGVAGETFC